MDGPELGVVEASLARLGRRSVGLYMHHFPSGRVSIPRLMDLDGLTNPERQDLRRLLDKAVEGAIGEAAGSGSHG